MQKIDIIHKPSNDEPFVVINKPSGLPSAPLNILDKENALCQAACIFPEILSVNGKKNIEFGLLHRLDTVTSGIMLIATSQIFYDFLQNEQKNGNFIKTYSAKSILIKENSNKLGGFPRNDFINYELLNTKTNNLKISVESYFRPYGVGSKLVRPVTMNSGMAALKKCSKKTYSTNLNISFIKKEGYDALFDIKCKIKEGFRHQVRCHLAWIGLPILGDDLYNFYTDLNKKIEFVASSIEFTNPITNKKQFFQI